MNRAELMMLIGSSGAIGLILGILISRATKQTKKVVKDVIGKSEPGSPWMVSVAAEELRLLHELETIADKYIVHRRSLNGMYGDPGSWFKYKASQEVELFGSLADTVDALKKEEANKREETK